MLLGVHHCIQHHLARTAYLRTLIHESSRRHSSQSADDTTAMSYHTDVRTTTDLSIGVGVSGVLRPDRYCLSCLCTAATDCDVTTGCVNDAEGAVCGPFYMSEPYWKDADLRFSSQFSGHG